MKAVLFALAFLVAGAWIGAKESPNGYWTGELHIVEVNYGGQTFIREQNYRLYQDPAGIARRELTLTWGGGMPCVGCEIRIYDYPAGTITSFDRSGSVAFEAPSLSPASGQSKTLEGRVIMGYHCTGRELSWRQHTNRYLRVRDTWTATRTTFKTPLLAIEYAYDSSGALIYMRSEYVTSFSPSGPLAEELFRAPAPRKLIKVTP